MSETKLIPLADALKTGFSASTKDELRAYWRETFGENAPPAMKPDKMVATLLREHGIVNEFTGAAIPIARTKTEEIFPPYNVSPNGPWGGRMHRVKVGKPPDATKNESVWVGTWNGSPPIELVYNEVTCIPEPVYLRIRAQEHPVPVSKTVPNEFGGLDVTTELRIDDRHQISYLGVDPATTDRAGSLTEWYQSKGPNWFRARSDRELQLIAQRLEERWQDRDGRPLPREDIQGRLIEFFFGHAEAVDAEAA